MTGKYSVGDCYIDHRIPTEGCPVCTLRARIAALEAERLEYAGALADVEGIVREHMNTFGQYVEGPLVRTFHRARRVIAEEAGKEKPCDTQS